MGKKKKKKNKKKKKKETMYYDIVKKKTYIYIAQTIKFAAEKQRNWEGRKEKTELKGSFQFYL